MSSASICSCGDPNPHVVMRRRTFDEKTVGFWSDGNITGPFHFGIKGVGRPRSKHALDLALRANQLVADELGLYEYSELPKLIQVARRAITQLSCAPRSYLMHVMAGEQHVRLDRHGQVWTWRKP